MVIRRRRLALVGVDNRVRVVRVGRLARIDDCIGIERVGLAPAALRHDGRRVEGDGLDVMAALGSRSKREWRGSLLVLGNWREALLGVRVGIDSEPGVGLSIGVSGGISAFLFTELGEPKIAAGLVADIHRLAELALGGDAVEGKGIDGDCDKLD